jgi:hypothetical protein
MYSLSQRKGLVVLGSEVEVVENVFDESVEITIYAIESVVFKVGSAHKVEFDKFF